MGFTVDNIGVGMSGQGFGGTIDGGVSIEELNVDKRDRWGWAARNSLAVGRSSIFKGQRSVKSLGEGSSREFLSDSRGFLVLIRGEEVRQWVFVSGGAR